MHTYKLNTLLKVKFFFFKKLQTCCRENVSLIKTLIYQKMFALFYLFLLNYVPGEMTLKANGIEIARKKFM